MKAQIGSLLAGRPWVCGAVSRGENLSIGTCALSMVAGVTGLEPATSGLTGRRSKPTELHPQTQPPATASCRARSCGRLDVMHASPSCQRTSCPSWPGTPTGGAYAVIGDRGWKIKGGGKIFGPPISAAFGPAAPSPPARKRVKPGPRRVEPEGSTYFHRRVTHPTALRVLRLGAWSAVMGAHHKGRAR